MRRRARRTNYGTRLVAGLRRFIKHEENQYLRRRMGIDASSKTRSFPRRRESIRRLLWIPAFAGMSGG